MDTRILEFDEVDSTQDLARLNFDGTPTLVVAARQTRGRGRSGTEWETAPRALACSLAFNCDWPTAKFPLIPLVAALALSDKWSSVRIKWPNDLFIDGRKVGGILVEAHDAFVVVGMGLNLWWPDAPEDRTGRYDVDPGPEKGVPIAYGWAHHFLERMHRGPEDWGHDEYAARSWLLGTQVTWEPDGEGRAVGIDDDGALLVEVDGVRQRVVSGAVHTVRKQPL